MDIIPNTPRMQHQQQVLNAAAAHFHAKDASTHQFLAHPVFQATSLFHRLLNVFHNALIHTTHQDRIA